nr:FAD-binding oxidoreductase [Pseudonocardia dioxanivorans]
MKPRRRDMLWSGWGDPEKAVTLPPGVVTLLEQALGVQPAERPPVALSEVTLPPPKLDMAVSSELAMFVGPPNLHSHRDARIRHATGRSTTDLLRLRAGDASGAPDAVVLPATHNETLGVLGACARRRVAVVPFGGGTSVVGGLAADRAGYSGLVAVDVRRMTGLVSLDAESLTATFQAGTPAVEAEELLAAKGFTLGHFPQSFQWARLGGFAATRSAGQASAGYGRFDEMVLALKVATPEGTIELGRGPSSAAGPDLRQLILGSEGAFGVITELTVRVHAAPERTLYQAWRFGSFAEGVAAVRELAQRGPLPTVLRLSDEAETGVDAGLHGRPADGGCLVVAGYDGTSAGVEPFAAAGAAALAAAGGTRLDDAIGEGWAAGRFDAPYLRDALLDAGAIAETLETATSWSTLVALKEAVTAALTASLSAQGTPPLVMCHVSHVYPTGASLYFTVVAAARENAVAAWGAAKKAATDAIVDGGGTLTHHHGVGVEHRPWLEREIGPLGVEMLRAVKARLDPAGILNPGVLVP